MRILQLTVLFCLICLIPVKSQELGYINDSDGYTNLRLKPTGKSDVIGIITTGQEFKYYPNKNSDWWQVDFNFRTGFMHKSKIKDFNKVKSMISDFLQEYYSADRNNAEMSEVNNENLFLLTQDYPLATSKAFYEQGKETQTFLISNYEAPVNDLIDLQLIYSRLISIKSPLAETYKIAEALKVAANKMNEELKDIKVFDYNIHDCNIPDKYHTSTNKRFTSRFGGKSIIYFLNHPKIDTYAKMYYEGQFSIFDNDQSFAMLDSLLTLNNETKAFYLYIFDSVLRLSDGALSEHIGNVCRVYLEKYPCEFIDLKNNKLYADNYIKWIDHAAFEYYYEQKPIEAINKNIDLIKTKVKSDCPNKLRELERIRILMIERIKEIKNN